MTKWVLPSPFFGKSRRNLHNPNLPPPENPEDLTALCHQMQEAGLPYRPTLWTSKMIREGPARRCSWSISSNSGSNSMTKWMLPSPFFRKCRMKSDSCPHRRRNCPYRQCIMLRVSSSSLSPSSSSSHLKMLRTYYLISPWKTPRISLRIATKCKKRVSLTDPLREAVKWSHNHILPQEPRIRIPRMFNNAVRKSGPWGTVTSLFWCTHTLNIDRYPNSWECEPCQSTI